MPAPPRASYPVAAEPFPDPVATALRALMVRFKGASMVLPLDVPPRVAGLPWEALVTLATGGKPMRLYRRRPEPRVVEEPDEAAGSSVFLLSGPDWRRFTVDVWDGWPVHDRGGLQRLP